MREQPDSDSPNRWPKCWKPVGMEDEEDLDSCLYLQKPSRCLLERLEKTLVHVSDKSKGPL